jgi:hypothetical protein
MRLARRPNRPSLWLLIGLTVWLGMMSVTHGVAGASYQNVCAAAGGLHHSPADDSGVHRTLEAFHDCPLCATAWGPLTEPHRGLVHLPTKRVTQAGSWQGHVLVSRAVTPPSRAPPHPWA